MDRPSGTAHDTAAGTEARTVPRARLRPPQVRALRRDRLLASLAGAADHRLILITGPAGWGKTTLLAQLVDATAGPTAWYRIDPADGREATLLGHLGRALAPAVPGLPGAGGEGWRSLGEASAALDAPGSDAVPDRVVLALDDLHLVAGTPAEAALGRLAELAPPWLVLAATCRRAPRWNLSRLRVSGALYEVGPDDLRFRSWEVERLFADVYGEPLPPADLARLARGLEGWAAGLQLFHLATRGKHASERRRAVAALPARSKLIRDYLSGNVLDELPDDQRAFVVDTSVLGRLTPALCDRLRDRSDSRRLLGDLEAHQVFVTRLDEDDLAFRYHEVFRAYLETRLVERDGEQQAKEWARLGAALLEDEGGACLSDALRAYCWAGDWASVGRVLETGGAELADDPGSWLDWLPTGLIEDDPWVMIATARRAAATGRLAAALDRYERVEHLHAGSAPRDISRRERAVIRAWLDPTAPAPPGWSGRLRTILRSEPVPPPANVFAGTVVGVTVGSAGEDESAAGDAAPVVAPGPMADGAGDALVDAVGAVLAGQLGRASGRLEALVDDPDVPLPLAVGARVALAVASALAGRPVDGDLGDLAELVELVDLPWLSSLALAASGLAGGAGTARAAAVAAECEAQGDPWGAAAARTFAALGDLLAGGRPVAELEELIARVRRLEATTIECWCAAWLAGAQARAGDPRAGETARAAERLAARSGVPGAEVWALEVQARLAAGAEAEEHAARAEAIRRLRAVDVAVPAQGAAAGATAPAGAPAGGEASGEVDPGSGSGAGVASRPAGAPGPGLRVRCLGGFLLELDGTPVDVAAVKPRARAALHLLAAHGGRPVHTETLVDALWPDLDAASGKRNLQVAVSSLRRLLDDHATGASALVRREGAAYALALPDVSCSDVAVFAAACREARDAARAGDGGRVLDAGDRALVAYGGDLLPEAGPVDWVVELRRQLAADATEVAQLVAEQALGLGYRDVAAIACARGLDIDRYHDGLWRLLIDAQEQGGDVAAATRTQERYQDVLRELGLSPEGDGGGPLAAASDQALA